jgi:LacI family transcriptional regulator
LTTIRDVAERAQVSVGTVSRVINDHPSVNPAIRRVVLEAIEELRFRPNVVARNLATARTRTLGLLLSDLRNSELAAAAISGAEAVAQEHGYALLVADTQRDAAVEAQHLRSLLDRRVDGLLCAPVAGGTIRELVRAAGVPTVVFGRGKPDGSLPTAVLSFAAATEEAVEHLVEVGHRRIGIISRVPDFSIGAAAGLRAPDIRRSLRARNTEGGRAFDLRATSPAECTRLVQHLFADERRPTALFVNALYLIPATIMGVRAAGLSIPDDVSVIAYGDSDWSQVVEPPLNVIAADLVAHLQAAARLLVGLIEQPYGPLPTIEHHGRYIRRGSVTSSPASRVASIDGVGRARLRSYG